VNSRGWQPTEQRGKTVATPEGLNVAGIARPVRPLRGRGVNERQTVGCHPRLFVFVPFGDVADTILLPPTTWSREGILPMSGKWFMPPGFQQRSAQSWIPAPVLRR
jgi:hypothetical protein